MPTDREILALAIPALGALIAEPLYVLGDTAIIGHLGTVPLAGLALSGLLLSEVFGFCTFLEYGTTARAARLYGAGRVDEALDVGVQATWLALGLGVVLALALELVAAPAMHAMAGGSTPAAAQALEWMRIASLGAPFVLVTAAAQGWMRALQDTRTPLVVIGVANLASIALSAALVFGAGMGIRGSAIANVTAQAASGLVFLVILARKGAPLRPSGPPHPGAVRGRPRPHAAHRRVLHHVHRGGLGRRPHREHDARSAPDRRADLDVLRPLPRLDGDRRPGADRPPSGRGPDRCRAAARPPAPVGRRAPRRARSPSCSPRLRGHPAAFTSDEAVIAKAHVLWPWLVAMMPLNGWVFALDGILFGAGDLRFMRNVTVAGALLGYLPLTLATAEFGWGLTGIWVGISTFIWIRAAIGFARWRGAALAGRRRQHGRRGGLSPPAAPAKHPPDGSTDQCAENP